MEKNQDVTEWIREELRNNIDEEYKKFHKSLVPGLQIMMGVRIPKIRDIAKKAAKEGYEEVSLHADTSVYEELMIRGMMIGYGKLTNAERKEELEKFVPLINNWAVCDSCCTTYKFMKKDQEEWFAFISKFLYSGNEFEIRFAVVCMLDFFVNEVFIDRILQIFTEIQHDGYYVKMAVAWAVSVCYVKFPKETEKLLTDNLLDDFTHNKSIQKIRESYRVSKEDKEKIKYIKAEGTQSMKAQINDKIRIVNKMNDWCMDYKEGDIFTVENTWYGGVNVTSRTGVPLSIDEVEYEVIGQENTSSCENWKVIIHADSAARLEQAMTYAAEILETSREKGRQAEIEILANGAAVKVLQSEFTDNESFGELYGQGVKFLVCEKALEELGIGKEALWSGIKTVASAAVELVKKQMQGFVYIKA